VIVDAPVHVPVDDDSVCPSMSVPVTSGRTVFTGGAGGPMTAVGFATAVATPASLVAVIAKRIVWPTSAGVSAYVEPAAPAIAAQLVPAASQRRHSRAKVSGAVPLQVPVVAVSVWPSRALPDTPGSAVFDGGFGVTTEVIALVAIAVPSGLVAVTTSRIVDPMSPVPTAYVGVVAVVSRQARPSALQRCQRRV
jgi:hypothetical protein